MLLRQAIVGGFDWVDLETDVADAVPRFGKVRRIVSYHNMREMPATWRRSTNACASRTPTWSSWPCAAQQPTDNLRVLALMDKPAKPTVAIGMGDMGFCTRILGAKYGAPFTYAAFNKERGIAPGLPSLRGAAAGLSLRQDRRRHAGLRRHRRPGGATASAR